MARWGAMAVACACAGAAQAGELTLGLGYDDLFDRSGAAALGLQLQSDPLARLGPFDLGLGAGIETDTDGDAWGGAGLVAAVPLRGGFTVSGSVMAGGYAVGDGGHELGSGLEFRSRLGVARALRGGPWSVGLALEHKSNGGLGDSNPGVETLFVTVGRRF